MTKSQMQTVVTAVLTALEGSKTAAKAAKAETSPADKAARQAAFAAKVTEVFGKLGVKVTPNEDVFTYNRWLKRGFRVKTGEKSTRVKIKGMKGAGIPLFHKGQVEVNPEAATTTASA